MSDGHDPILEAVEALKLRGHKVEPWGKEFDAWLVDGDTLTDGEMMALALRLGLMESTTTRLQ